MKNTRNVMNLEKIAVLAWALVLSPPAEPSPVARFQGGPALTAPYRTTDRVEGAWLNLGLFPVRPLLVHELEDELTVIAANLHDDRVEWFQGLASAPFRVTRVGWSPVALAGWEDGAGELQQVLAVCAGSYGLFRIDAGTGEVVGVIELPPQPRDILVDQASDRAWVSCVGTNEVAEIDLVDGVVARRYSLETEPAFRCQQPLFLSFDGSGRILVAPMISGNNTTAYADLDALDDDVFMTARHRVLDLDDPAIVPPGTGQGLPDEDLFAIDPGASSPGAVSVLAHGQGTVLFAQGVNPLTGEHWQLGTEALNADPARHTEPALRGHFSESRVAIRSLAAPPHSAPLTIDIDTDDPTEPIEERYDAGRSIGRPNGLTFASNGFATITGPLTDTLAIRKPNGKHFRRWALPAGSRIPTAVVLDADETFLFVHCHGSNEILRYDVVIPVPEQPAPSHLYRLERNPTPPRILEGMKVHFDAKNSFAEKASCDTCHPNGGSDGVCWPISKGEEDFKGPMATQTLTNILKTSPYHWRGENEDLVAFRPAFQNLLGAEEEVTPGEFDLLEEFVFSLIEPANARQDFERRLNDAIHAPDPFAAGSAVVGQTDWFDTITVGNLSCNGCHDYAAGAAGHEILPDVSAGHQPKRVQFDVAGFQEIGRRAFQPPVEIRFFDPEAPGGLPVFREETRAYLGVGSSHAGLAFSFRDFVAGLPIGEPIKDNLSAFAFQFDTGLAPSAHFAAYLDAGTPPAVLARLQLAAEQALAENCDLALMGFSHELLPEGDGALEPVDWFWDQRLDRFVSDGSPGHPDRTLADFLSRTATERHVVLGVPVGMAERLAVDRDMDGLRDALEPPGGETDPAIPEPPDVAPEILDDPRVLWAARGAARIVFETDIPARTSVTAVSTVPGTAPFTHEVTATSDVFSRRHSVLLTDLLPSNEAQGSVPQATLAYDVVITAWSRADLSSTASGLSFETRDRVRPRTMVVGELEHQFFAPGDGGLQAAFDFRVDYAGGGSPPVGVPEVMLVARVFVHEDGAIVDPFPNPRPLGALPFHRAQAIAFNDGGFLDMPGPFVLGGPTLSTGEGQLLFRLPPGSVVLDDEVSLVVEALLELPPDPGARAEFLSRLASATSCALTGGVNSDCDGDGTNDCCRFDVNRNSTQTARWSFPATLEENRMVTGTVE